jgi:hypothetical protein
MGSGGYATAIPKWEKMEADILAKGIAPESLNWPKRAKNWFFAHGGRLDLETGKLVHGPKLERATQRFSYALQLKLLVRSGPIERRMNWRMPSGPLNTVAEREV